MDNNFTVSNKEKTFTISISWESEMDKDDKFKVQQIVLQSLSLWDSTQKLLDAIKQQPSPEQ